MRKLVGDCFFRSNYLSIILILTLVVLIYVFVLQREVQDEFENKMFVQELLVKPVWLTSLVPDKVVHFILDSSNFLHKTDKRFLSFSIDSSQIYHGLRNPSLSNKKLRRIVSHIGGGYLRIGGRAADSLVFSPAFRAWPDKHYPLDGGYCSFTRTKCPDHPKLWKFSMYGCDWNELNEFASATGLKLLFDLNVLLRDNNNNWNSSNAELLLDFSFAYQYKIDWQLGNEPNSFKHLFGMEVPPENLAKDFNSLRSLLQRYWLYNSSLIVGPDTTHPRHEDNLEFDSTNYLKEFLKMGPPVDAISWHFYNTGPDASLNDYLNVTTYDNFILNCSVVLEIVKKSKCSTKPVWLSETGTSYGGGAHNLSDRFVGSLLWTDKLGSGAKLGISVIVRQSLYRGAYALIDPTSLTPNPDYWVSVLYRQLVKETVLNLTIVTEINDSTLRAYAHCSTGNSVTIFGVNIANISQGFYLPLNATGHLFCLHSSDLQSRSVELNGNKLILQPDGSLPTLEGLYVDFQSTIPIPSYSIFFLRLNIYHPACSS